MTSTLHHDEAIAEAAKHLSAFADAHGSTAGRAVLLDDIFGRLRLLIAPKKTPAKLRSAIQELAASLSKLASPYWAGEEPWIFSPDDTEQDLSLFEEAWRDGAPVPSTQQVRITTRVRDHAAWFVSPVEPPWPTSAHAASSQGSKRRRSKQHEGPPIIAFLSFKGGVGRTTALAAFAIQRARRGETVAVVDLDLDAPGIGLLFDDDPPGTTATHGVVDFLLESPLAGGKVAIEDYVHRCRRLEVVGDGAIIVMPAGKMEESYLSRLARVDLELQADQRLPPLFDLLAALRRLKPTPDWILLDGRAGLSEVAGVLTSGIAHLHVLLATANEQSFAGIERFVHRLGADRLRAEGDLSQGDVIVAQSMTPPRQLDAAIPMFRDRITEIFRSSYLTDQADAEDRFWSVEDIDHEEGPHQPVVLLYRDEYAFFRRIDQIAGSLSDDASYKRLGERIVNRFPHVEDKG